VGMMNPEDTVLDIGANIGFMSYFLSRRVKKGLIYSFEPIPENIKNILRVRKFFRLSNVRVQDYALGSEKNSLTMVMPVIGNARKQGLSHVVSDERSKETGIIFSVDQNRLDDITLLKDKKIQGIKIDVENYEYEVFKGAQELLRASKPIIYCELWDNENRKKCFNLLTGLGYQIKVLINGNLMPFENDQHKTQNFFFVADIK
jgi:FkbM family methyltransferase